MLKIGSFGNPLPLMEYRFPVRPHRTHTGGPSPGQDTAVGGWLSSMASPTVPTGGKGHRPTPSPRPRVPHRALRTRFQTPAAEHISQAQLEPSEVKYRHKNRKPIMNLGDTQPRNGGRWERRGCTAQVLVPTTLSSISFQ